MPTARQALREEIRTLEVRKEKLAAQIAEVDRDIDNRRSALAVLSGSETPSRTRSAQPTKRRRRRDGPHSSYEEQAEKLLRFIDEHPDEQFTPSRLAERSGVPRSTIVAVVEGHSGASQYNEGVGLIEQGLVEKVGVTPRGRAIVAATKIPGAKPEEQPAEATVEPKPKKNGRAPNRAPVRSQADVARRFLEYLRSLGGEWVAQQELASQFAPALASSTVTHGLKPLVESGRVEKRSTPNGKMVRYRPRETAVHAGEGVREGRLAE